MHVNFIYEKSNFPESRYPIQALASRANGKVSIEEEQSLQRQGPGAQWVSLHTLGAHPFENPAACPLVLPYTA
jgi:hypothetical protein